MNKKAGTIVLIFLLAGMLLISGCIQNNNERNTTIKNLPILAKGMRMWTSKI